MIEDFPPPTEISFQFDSLHIKRIKTKHKIFLKVLYKSTFSSLLTVDRLTQEVPPGSGEDEIKFEWKTLLCSVEASQLMSFRNPLLRLKLIKKRFEICKSILFQNK